MSGTRTGSPPSGPFRPLGGSRAAVSGEADAGDSTAPNPRRVRLFGVALGIDLARR